MNETSKAAHRRSAFALTKTFYVTAPYSRLATSLKLCNETTMARDKRSDALIPLEQGARAAAVVLALLAMASPALAQPGSGPQSPPSAPVPVAVFGADNRTTLPPALRPMRDRLGILFNIRQRTVCTAFCVGPDTIGTAAHCLFKTKGEKPPRLMDFWFARNYDSVRDYARIAGFATGGSAQSVIAGSTALSTTPPIDATKDWAFIRLATAVCNKGIFEIEPLPVDQIIQQSKAGKIYQLSYHKDFKQWQPAYSGPCPVDRAFAKTSWATIAADFDDSANLVLHTCDTGGASSGSPLLVDTPAGPKVVGINVGTYVQSRAIVHEGPPADKATADVVANTAVAATAFQQQYTAFREARLLASAEQLRELQQRLQQLGHYTGSIDGTYGPTLKTAIMAFESAAALPRTGIASEDILMRLRRQTASRQSQGKSR